MIYLLPEVALAVVTVVAQPLMLLQKKQPPEADKSPGPPELPRTSLSACEFFCSTRPPIVSYFTEVVVAVLLGMPWTGRTVAVVAPAFLMVCSSF